MNGIVSLIMAIAALITASGSLFAHVRASRKWQQAQQAQAQQKQQGGQLCLTKSDGKVTSG